MLTYRSKSITKRLPCVLGEPIEIFVEHSFRLEHQRVFEDRGVDMRFREQAIDWLPLFD